MPSVKHDKTNFGKVPIKQIYLLNKERPPCPSQKRLRHVLLK